MKRPLPTACSFDILLLVCTTPCTHNNTHPQLSQHVYLSTRGDQVVFAACGTFLGPSKTLHHSPADLPTPLLSRHPHRTVASMSLECYWKLVSTDPGERIQAAHELIEAMVASSSSSSTTTTATENGGDHPHSSSSGLSADVEYAIKRLVRGLSSSTEAARQGFAACLAEMLAALPHVPLALVKEHMVASTEVTGSVKGQEERDMLLGRLFTCLAVARSGRLTSNDKEWEPTGMELLETAIGIFSKRKVLRSLAAEAVVAMLECMPPKRFCRSSQLVTQLGQSLGASVPATAEGEEDGKEELGLETLNPDQLGVGLAVQAYLRKHGLLKHKDLEGKFPKWLLTSKRILKGKRVYKLLEPLKASSSAFPQMHPVWDRIFDELLPEGDSSSSNNMEVDEEGEGDHEATLQALWMLVVDGVLACGTHERKALSLMLLQRVSSRASATQLPLCLSPHVLKVLLMSLATAGTADEILKPLAKQTLDTLSAAGKLVPEKRLVVASALLTRCDVNFDLKTGTTTVQGLLSGLSTDALLAFVRHLVKAYNDAESSSSSSGEKKKGKKGKGGDEEVEEKDAADAAEEAATVLAKKAWAVDALYALSKTPAVAKPEGTGVTLQVLRLLLSLAYFNTEKFNRKKIKSAKKSGKKEEDDPSSWILIPAASGSVPPEVRKVAAARLHSLLAEMGKREALRFKTSEGGLGSLGWLWATHEAWRGLEEHGAELFFPLGEGAREARETMLGLVGGIRGKEGGMEGGNKVGGAFAALIMQIGLGQLSLVERGGEEDFLGDLCRCYDDLVGKATTAEKKEEKKEKGKKGGKKAEEEEEKVDAMAVLADVCVGALSTAQAGVAVRGLRDVIRKAWGLVCMSSPITRPALDVLLGVICNVPAGGQGGEEGEEGESEEESGSDLEERGSEEEDEEEEIMVDSNDKAAFRRLLGGGDDENQAALSHMLALRQANHQGGKESRMEAERLSLQHRLRTLDLLEVVASKQPNAGLLLLTIRPCLKALKTLQAQAGPGKPSELVGLSHRLAEFLNKRLAKTRPRLVPVVEGAAGVEEEEVQTLAQALMVDVKKSPTTATTNTLMTCLTICTRSALFSSTSNGGPPPEWLLNLYRGALEEYMTTRTSLTAAPFEQLVARFPSPACLVMLGPLNRYAVEASKAFRQAEAFRMVGLLLAQRRVFGPEAKLVLKEEMGGLLAGLTRVLREQGGEMNSKRLKPLVECCQSVATVLKDGEGAVEEEEKSKKGGKKKGGKATSSGGVDTAEAALGLGRLLVKVQEGTASEGLKMSCLHLARQLGVPTSEAGEPPVQVEGGKKNHKKEKKEKKEEKKNKKRAREDEAKEVAEHKVGNGGGAGQERKGKGNNNNKKGGKESQDNKAQQKPQQQQQQKQQQQPQPDKASKKAKKMKQ